MQRIRDLLFVLLIGIILGSGTATWIVGRNSARELAGYESALADRDRQLADLTRELGEARGLAGQRVELDREIMATITEGMGAINKARSEYERALAGVKLAQSVYETLRKYYDPGYKGQPNVKN